MEARVFCALTSVDSVSAKTSKLMFLTIATSLKTAKGRELARIYSRDSLGVNGKATGHKLR